MAGNLNNVVLPLNQIPASIYYIHPSDANSIQLVSFKFGGDGFTSWKRAMLLTLSAKNKAGFVNGAYVRPTDVTSEEYKAWERCNDLVCSWILFNLEESIASSVMFMKSSRDIWLDLEEHFGYTSLAQIYALEQKLAEISQGSQSVSEFFTGIKSIWDAIDEAQPLPYCTCNNCTCNLTKRVFEHQQKMTLPKVTEAYRMFAQEEKHKEISGLSSQHESMAFTADRRFHSDSARSKNFRSQGSVTGHNIDRCFELNGFPPGFKGFKDKRIAAFSSSDIETMDTDDNQPKMISADQYRQLIDLLNSQKQNADSQNSSAPGHAMMADGSKLTVKFIGHVKLTDQITLQNVLFVPDFKYNLISVHKLCKDMDCELHFTHDKCFVHSQRGRSILLGSLKAGLYNVDDQASESLNKVQDHRHSCNAVCLAAVDDAKLWHLRLGHLPFRQLKIAYPKCDIKPCIDDVIYQVCPKAKQTRSSFPVSSIKTSSPFELLHIDVWGPHSVKTPSGCNQFLTIVDDFSRYTWVHLLKNKNDAVSVMKSFFSDGSNSV
uniref:Uncharacterized protein n=1 Tax=Chenopodium quinoa TaxID=63459 RepID=A0A803MBX8_CHEQI